MSKTHSTQMVSRSYPKLSIFRTYNTNFCTTIYIFNFTIIID